MGLAKPSKQAHLVFSRLQANKAARLWEVRPELSTELPGARVLLEEAKGCGVLSFIWGQGEWEKNKTKIHIGGSKGTLGEDEVGVPLHLAEFSSFHKQVT